MEAFLTGGKGSLKGKSNKQKAKEFADKRVLPWVEKYRPKCVSDVAYQDEVVAVLKKAVQGADVPNFLFYGPPGTGKTSAILAVCRELYGVEMMKVRVLELNASDERGIQVVRDKVKTFAQQAVAMTRPDGKRSPPFKMVILDEADSMTSSAQAALRRTMEKQSKNTRFCLICNYISRIIEPLTSRCSKFRFKPLSVDILKSRLQHIVKEEGMSCDETVIDGVISASQGDLRRAINLLQSTSHLKGSEEVTEQDVIEIAGVVPDKLVEDLFSACRSNSYDQLECTVSNLLSEGYAVSQMLLQFHDMLVPMDTITDTQKSVIAERMGMVEHNLMDGADEYLQAMDLLTVVMTQLNTNYSTS